MMLNFWYNIATGDESKVSTILYKWAKSLYDQNIFKSVWLDKIKATLGSIGMSNCFDNITNMNNDWFKNTIKLKINDSYNQIWLAYVLNNSTCLNYRVMTERKFLQDYLVKLPSQYMYAMCKFKCANHIMPIVSGRHNGITVDDRKCNLCDLNDHFNRIGDEFHYLFNCPFFREDRAKYLKRYYYTSPNMYKMTQLFNYVSKQEMLKLAKFICIILRQFRNS